MFIAYKIKTDDKSVFLFIHCFFLTLIARHEKNSYVIVATMLGGDHLHLTTSSD
jgi:hypothetical protein